MEIQGAVPAIVTPFTDGGDAVDEKALHALVDRVVSAGAGGVIACGGTGEFIALSPEERRRVVEVSIEATAGRVPVYAQTGGLSTRQALEYTAHAEQAGADGLMVAPPFYEALSPEVARGYFLDVAAATALPVMLYNYPNGTGLHMTAEFVSSLAAEADTIRYVKDSSADALLLAQLVTVHQDAVKTFCGEDVLLLDAIALGAHGMVTDVFNFMMPVFATLLREAAAGNTATVVELWREITPLIVTLASNPYTSGVKAACEIVGHSVGGVRAPLPSISAAGREQLANVIAGLDPAYFA